MSQPSSTERILLVIRTNRRGRGSRGARTPSDPVAPRPTGSETSTPRAPAQRDGDRAVDPRARCNRIATALLLTVASVCFMAALVFAAAIHFLFVQDRLGWVHFVLLLSLALSCGLVGWRVLSILRSGLRRALGVLPDTDADA